ncbi:hypothetical protein CRUP_026770 [Coryphaenoides rupestris]|nr:hypothetical protein CRUP_026770 [Coryphaenoides rupestris]
MFDYQEEITLVEDNKQQLHQAGRAPGPRQPPLQGREIEHKLAKVDERWQHLLDLIGASCDETLVAVQQLDKNMSSLRSWLAHIETELSRPIAYDSCDFQEIQRKLDLQQHSTGVASVLNLCEVLLHDCDACATDTECDSIQQATRSLDRRWRSICALSMDRRLKKLGSGEQYGGGRGLAFEQYRRLARENRTDGAGRLRGLAHDGNQRWDELQKRVASILRRLKVRRLHPPAPLALAWPLRVCVNGCAVNY